MVRINKFLSSCELGSRRKVEQLILDKKVRVNGELVTDLSTTVDPTHDEVRVGRHIVKPRLQKIWLMLHKPRGYVVTKNDEFNRKTIYDLLPDFAQVLHPVGRLDYESEGLLLLTNDGDITNKLTHPAYRHEKLYKVVVKGQISMDSVKKLRSGVTLDDQTLTHTAKVYIKHANETNSELKITLTEGKNRQLRRMCETVGHEVISLKRLQIADIKMEKLPSGAWRFLTDREILSIIKTKKKIT
jgi:23S rRNA pseudouridine2605 synthase